MIVALPAAAPAVPGADTVFCDRRHLAAGAKRSLPASAAIVAVFDELSTSGRRQRRHGSRAPADVDGTLAPALARSSPGVRSGCEDPLMRRVGIRTVADWVVTDHQPWGALVHVGVEPGRARDRSAGRRAASHSSSWRAPIAGRGDASARRDSSKRPDGVVARVVFRTQAERPIWRRNDHGLKRVQALTMACGSSQGAPARREPVASAIGCLQRRDG